MGAGAQPWGTEVSVCSWGATPGTGTGQDQVAQAVRASILFS